MYDIVVAQVPFTPLERPPLELANIKGALEHAGISNKTIDLSMEMHKYCISVPDITDSLFKICSGESKDPVGLEMFESWTRSMARKLISLSNKWIAIRVDNPRSQWSAYALVREINDISDKKVIVFGQGLIETPTHPIMDSIHESMLGENLGMSFMRLGIIDDYIIGDPEEQLINVVQGQVIRHGFNLANYKRDDLPFANYDDIELDRYWGQVKDGPQQLPIRTSKGCIRNCDFCVYPDLENKYRFRTGINIAEEMIHLAEKYGIREFNFIDAIANGNMTSVRQWTNEIAMYNKSFPKKKITWASGGWICRPVGALNSPEFFDRLKASGCVSLTIGSETGSNNVLDAMNKNTNVEAMYYEMEQLNRVGINFVLTFVHGHWSETWDDFLETADMLYKIGPYARAGTLGSITTNTFSLKPKTPAFQNRADNQLVDKGKDIWWTPLNPSLTMKERFYRTLLLRKLRDELKMHETFHDAMHHDWTKVTTDFEMAKTFYGDIAENLKDKPVQNAAYYYYNFGEFLNLLFERDSDLFYSFEFEVHIKKFTHQKFHWDLLVDDVVIADCWPNDSINDGTFVYSYKRLSMPSKCKIGFRFNGKGENGTVVDKDGNILKDSFIKFLSFKINGIDLLKDEELFYNSVQYTVDGVPTDVVPGYWGGNAELTLEFDAPFTHWYTATSNAHTEFKVMNLTEHTPVHREAFDDEALEASIIQHLEQFDY